MEDYLSENTPKLFKLYEKVLNAYCRDINLEKAKKDPESFMVRGSMQFIDFLHNRGVKNYFVTGAVVEEGKGMFEEVVTLGYKLGAGQQMEGLIGSSWNHKLPKVDIMKELAEKLGAKGDEILVLGDGRSEITAGKELGAYNIGRLGKGAERQREILLECGADIIIEDFYDEKLKQIFGFEIAE
jgi:phosphoglycolate phosphatase-like HAD superfamily hydrolase